MKWRERPPLPKEIYMQLASLHRQFSEQVRAWNEEKNAALETIAAKYIPGIHQLEKELKDIEHYVREMNFAADHIRWQMDDLVNHTTPPETNTKLKASQSGTNPERKRAIRRERRKKETHG